MCRTKRSPGSLGCARLPVNFDVRNEKWSHIYDASDSKPHKQKEMVTMIPEKMLEVLKKDGVVAIATYLKKLDLAIILAYI